jgi:hypothetical protein
MALLIIVLAIVVTSILVLSILFALYRRRRRTKTVKCQVKQESPVQMACQVKQESPVQMACHVKQESPVQMACQVKQESPVQMACQVKQESPVQMADESLEWMAPAVKNAWYALQEQQRRYDFASHELSNNPSAEAQALLQREDSLLQNMRINYDQTEALYRWIRYRRSMNSSSG